MIDDILSRIDEQLAAGEPRTGYDYGDPAFPVCPHCGGDWHGLAITFAMRGMALTHRTVPPDYRYADDESGVWCPGSDTHWCRPPLQRHVDGLTRFSDALIDVMPRVSASFAAIGQSMRELAAAFDRAQIMPTPCGWWEWNDQMGTDEPVVLMTISAEPPTREEQMDDLFSPRTRPQRWRYECTVDGEQVHVQQDPEHGGQAVVWGISDRMRPITGTHPLTRIALFTNTPPPGWVHVTAPEGCTVSS